MHQGKWNGLGGKLEPGETPEQCVIREVAEESGLPTDDPVRFGPDRLLEAVLARLPSGITRP